MLPRLMRGGEIRLPLRTAGARLVVVLLAAIPGVVLGLYAARIAMAARLAKRLDAASLRRAMALDPCNGAYPHQLGLVEAYSPGPANLPDAIRDLEEATRLNPRKAQYWSDLGEVCDAFGDVSCSNPAAERAVQLSPATPRFEWKAANHYVQEGRVGEALPHFRRLLALDAAYAQPVFEVCLRVLGSPEEVDRQALPVGGGPRLQLAFLDFVSAQGDADLANTVWQRISSANVHCTFAGARLYVESLMARGNFQQATAVWRQLEQTGAVPKPAGDGAGNLVYNGRFAHAPLGAGLDWRARNVPYVETDFNDPSAFRGPRCLRVDYAAGKNLESEPVWEFVPVVPGRAYRLAAEVRSDGITSASGPRLRVTDPACAACLDVSTESVVGTTAWHAVTVDFAAGPSTRVVRLAVWRARCRSFPMEISGSFWLDDVSITALNSPPKDAALNH